MIWSTQGSILGPILFNNFINDIPKINSLPEITTSTAIYADDVQLLFSGTPNNLDQVKIYEETSLQTIKEWYSENGLKMNSNKTQCILFATAYFNKRTETFQITIDDRARHMEDKVKNLGVIFDSRHSFEHQIKSLCSRLNGTQSYLNRVKHTLHKKSRIFLINVLILSHLNYCSTIWGKCSEKLQYVLQKWINSAAKVASNAKYLKPDHFTPLFRDLKWINFKSILLLNVASIIYKNLYVSADSNVKMFNFDLRNMVSQRITIETALMYI